MFVTALNDVYNVDTSFASTLAKQGLTAVPHVLATSLDLHDLLKHDAIEHDASLVHADASTGDALTPQPALLEALLADAEGDYITITSIARTRRRREEESVKIGNPPLSAFLSTLAHGESALLLQVLGQFGPSGAGEYAVPKAAARQWLLEERLPDGFKKPQNAITLGRTGILSAQILAAKKLGGIFGDEPEPASTPAAVKPGAKVDAMPDADDDSRATPVASMASSRKVCHKK
jgi:hypothetical protein